MNITEFLEARIAEDEAVAQAAWCDSPWVAHERWHDIRGGRSFNTFAVMDGRREVTIVSMGGSARHIAHWHPIRVLAECAAKRAIVAEHNLVPQTYATSKNRDGPDVGCSICAEWDGLICGEGPCDTLRHLAAVYDQHPDYDQAWRVT